LRSHPVIRGRNVQKRGKMLFKGSFRVVDSWQGTTKAGKPAANLTLMDRERGGQFKVSFPDGKVPADCKMDVVLDAITVKPSLSSFGMTLSVEAYQIGK